MSDAKRIKLSVNFNNLPPEMVERILKLLHFTEICKARLICKRWKEIIDKSKLLENATGKIMNHSSPYCFYTLNHVSGPK